MTPADWEYCINDHSAMVKQEVINAYDGWQSALSLKLTGDAEVVLSHMHVKYMCKGRSTRLSQFYQTDIGRAGMAIDGKFGIWVPKKIVIADDGKYVVLPNWFDIDIVVDVW